MGAAALLAAPVTPLHRLRRAKVAALICRRGHVLALVILVVLGGWLRLSGTNWDDGAHLHPDERYLSIVANDSRWPSSPREYLDVADSPLSPFNTPSGRNYVYGTFPLFATKLAATAAARDDYGRLNLVGRRLSALVDSATIVLVYLTALLLVKEFGQRRARLGALLAAGLYAVTVTVIQAAHFFTVDSWAVMLGLGTFFVAACAVRSGVPPGWRRFIPRIALIGVGMGLTLACKVSGALVLIPVLLALVARAVLALASAPRRQVALQLVRELLTVAVAGYVTFRAVFPYAFAHSNWFDFSIAADYRAALEGQRSALAGDFLSPPNYQWLLSSRIWTPLENLVVWQLGVPLGLVALGGIAMVGRGVFRSGAAAHTCGDKARRARAIEAGVPKLMLLAFVLAVFLYFGSLFAHTGRYQLPIVPFVCIAAAYGVVALSPGSRAPLLAAAGALFAATFVYALAFHRIYTHENTRVAASDWLVTHVPAHAAIANEHWDDGLPLGAPAAQYGQVIVPVFDPDDGGKLNKLYAALAKADYYVLSSPRAWKTIGRLPQRFPLMTRFYEELFAGRLGFRLAASFTSEPELLGVRLHDLGAEEAFWVYDHPPVMIFRRLGPLDRASFARSLCPTRRKPACP